MSTKKYGLILPNKNIKPTFEAKRNVFGNDDDSEEEAKKPTFTQKRQHKILQSKAVDEDPTVYQYDEVYDEIKEKVNEDKQKVKSDRNPKYIENLLKTAQKRKLENERRVERQVQKEREKEGDEFADKEIFVTSTYKKKLEEMRKEDEKEKYEDYLEQIGDVTKQKDLGGFYRHLYEQKLGSVKNKTTDESKKECDNQKSPNKNQKNKTNSEIIDDGKPKTNRNYRKRISSSEQNQELSEGEIVSDDEINRLNLDDIKAAKKSRKDVNLDEDSDFSVNDPTDSETEPDNNRITPEIKKEVLEKPDIKEIVTENIQDKAERQIKSEKVNDEPKFEIENKPKIDIWKKRTVGVVFEEALKRYYERKAAKCG